MKYRFTLMFVFVAFVFVCLTAAFAERLLFPINLKTIEEEAFMGDTSIDEVTLGNKVESIGARAFSESSLRTIHLSSSIKFIDDTALPPPGTVTVTAPENSYAYVWAVKEGYIPHEVSNIDDFIIEDGVIYGYRGLDAYVTIPSKDKDGNTITAIASNAFHGWNSVRGVEIPETITSIGTAAFMRCNDLIYISVDPNNSAFSSVNGVMFDKSKTTLVYCPEGVSGEYTIPDGVKTIGETAFVNNRKLTKVNIPNCVETIERNAFEAMDRLESITIPKGVMRIGIYAFGGCSSLASIQLPDTVIEISSDAFAYCPSLKNIEIDAANPVYYSQNGIVFDKIKMDIFFMSAGFEGEFTVPDGVTGISAYTFQNCKGLTSIVFPDSVLSIGEYAFDGCENLTSVVMPETMERIGVRAFSICPKLTSITLPNGISSIEIGAFSGSGLTTVSIPNSVTRIEDGAFRGCGSLTSVFIPKSVVSIADDAFRSCGSLANINVDPENTTYCSENGLLMNKAKTVLIRCPGGIQGECVLPDSITEFYWWAFSGCGGMTSIIIPEGVTAISFGAFENCVGLKTVVLPNSLESIESYAFSNCSSLETITIPDKVTEIGEGVFQYCRSLTSIEIPYGVTAIGYREFGDCSNLNEVILPESVTMIGSEAFWFCSALTYIDIPNSVTQIGDHAFTACRSLLNVDLPNNLSVVESYVFEGCSSLESITVPDSVASIRIAAFMDCSSLEYVAIPANVSTIELSAFAGCSNLQRIDVDPNNESLHSVDGVLFSEQVTRLLCCPGGYQGDYVIPEGVTSIEEGAFSGCRSLKSIRFADGISTIPNYTVYGCHELERVHIPDSVTSIEEGNFDSWQSVTIYGNSGSYAETWAMYNGFEFVAESME